ncbi:hypothetical protein JCM19055_2818 [Geomicrobium sp. JCM 19055]|nr:hypothetical protein JCM19055_2818 [Geomicrobium sp. JCM 19055]
MFKRLFQRKSCFFCKGKTPHMKRYLTLEKDTVLVCEKCLEYAERRAFQKA